MLRVELTAQDLGRIRFAEAPAPVLETSLMLLELRQRPQLVHRDGLIDEFGPAWRKQAGAVFSTGARPLLSLAPTRRYVYFFDVVTADPQEAFERVHDMPRDLSEAYAERSSRLNLGPSPALLTRFDEGDAAVRTDIDRALRRFHADVLAPRWAQVTARFQQDLLARTSLLRRHGVAAVLNTLSPHLHLNGLTLEGSYPWDRRVRLNGRGLLLIPSAFWTAYPVVTWYDEEETQYALIYPALPDPEQPAQTREAITGPALPDPLAALLGRTRAAILLALGRPHATTALARQVGVSPAAVSTHTATLRAAGLITSQRQGQAVVHQLTELGSALLRQNY